MSEITTIRGRFESVRMWYAHLRKNDRQSFRAWLKTEAGRRIVREQMQRADEARVAHLRRDWREWTRDWRERPFGTGSGRRAFWLRLSFLKYALICRLLHERLGRAGRDRATAKRCKWYGWTGERIRHTARVLADLPRSSSEIDDLPMREVLNIAALPAGYYDENTLAREREGQATPAATAWRLWVSRVAKPAWGRYVLDAIVAELRREPERKTSPMIVGEIRRLRGEPEMDMRQCSGCEYLSALAERPELHDWLLSRAGQATPMKIGELDAVYVPFGLPYPAEFDHTLQMGLNYELRIRSADWDALDGAARSDVITGRVRRETRPAQVSA